MSATTIPWADESWNPLRWRRIDGVEAPSGYHCEKVAEECRFCYAEAFNVARVRGGNGLPFSPLTGDKQAIYLDAERLVAPGSWRKPKFVFPCSMTDWLGHFVPERYAFDLLAMSVGVPRHRYQFLTKRFDRAASWLVAVRADDVRKRVAALVDMLAAAETVWPPPQCWVGFTTGSQRSVDAAAGPMARIAAAGWNTWLSIEPLLEPLKLSAILPSVKWAVIGGESGPKARPCSLDWIRDVVRQCEAADVVPYVKQLGAKPFGTLGDRGPENGDILGNAAKRWFFVDRKGEDVGEWPLDLRKRLRPHSMMFETVL